MGEQKDKNSWLGKMTDFFKSVFNSILLFFRRNKKQVSEIEEKILEPKYKEIKKEEAKFIWPLNKLYKRITTPFSEIWIMNSKKKHTGIDIAAPVGAEVFSMADGVVEKIGYLDNERKMAQYIDIKHDLENYCTAYLHVTPTVKVGDKIKAGDIICNIAQLIDMGAHLHFNIWKGIYDNSITHRGALPIIEYASEFTDPVFPNNFIDPMLIIYSYIDDIKNT